MSALAFELPERLEAHEPPAERDAVRMLVARGDGSLAHARFRELPELLEPGDLVVVNTSGTLPRPRCAANELDVHLSTPLPGGPPNRWVVELRQRRQAVLGRVSPARRRSSCPPARASSCSRTTSGVACGSLTCTCRSRCSTTSRGTGARSATATCCGEQPLAAYQTVYVTEPGSAEMPSAGRPFTPELITALVSRGIAVAPIVLHTGVSSLEEGEQPYPERFRVPAATARLVAATRRWGRSRDRGRDDGRSRTRDRRPPDGSIAPAEGWTSLVVTPERGVRVVDGLLTGWHEPAASHLGLLEAVAGRELVAALLRAPRSSSGYLWHEFGDVHLLLPTVR